jgi:allophanate hydrolase
LVSFALGTDTAGSGRVPAALNNVVGLKPTRGLSSARGVVPACRSLDCVSVFAGNVADAALVLEIMAGFDARDPFSRPAPAGQSLRLTEGFRFGVPSKQQLEFFGDALSEAAYARAIEQLTELGGQVVPIDFEAFRQAGSLLYSGPWVAERAVSVGEFIARQTAGLDPTVASIIGDAKRWSAADAFAAQHRLRDLHRQVETLWQDMDVLVVPTVPTTYTREQIAADPLGPNQRLGTYTNFTNLLDLCGVAVPAGFKAKGQPFGVTLLGPAFADRAMIDLGSRLHQSYHLTVGATPVRVREPSALPNGAPQRRTPRTPGPMARLHQSIRLAVVGAHLQGQPLHFQLVELGARFEGAARTAGNYRLFALDGTVPAKPGLVRQSSGGASIEVEVYALDAAGFGQFVAQVAAPLVIGNVELSSGEWVKGFLCESVATEKATEITGLGGWRAYLART